MASSDPISVGYALLYSTLTGDATFMALVTGVYQVMAPVGSTPIYCLLNAQSATDVNAAIASRIMTTVVYQVKVVGPVENAATLRSAYARADALLQPGGLALRNAGGTLSCFREQTFNVGELNGAGALWLNLGGLYRVEV